MATDISTQVEQLYVAYFNRPADTAGLAFWSGMLANLPTGYQEMSANFATSLEYKSMYAGMDNGTIVSAVYEHLFGRAAESAGVTYWANLLDRKAITIDNVVTAIAGGAQGSDQVAYDAKVAVAGTFTAHIDTSLEQLAYSGAAANKIAFDYLANVKDAQTATAGMDAANIDAAIAKIVGTLGFGIGFGIGFDAAQVHPVA